MVDPADTHQIAAAMQKVVSDGELRSELIRRGLERVKLFSWERTARETVRVYEQMCTP